MGFRFRKSFGFGPFRTTISKSGISTSVGVKGARITKRADGKNQTTVSIPGTGISHVSTDSDPEVPVVKKRGCLGGCATAVGAVLVFFVLGLFAGGDKDAPSKMQEPAQNEIESASVMDAATVKYYDQTLSEAAQTASESLAVMYESYMDKAVSNSELVSILKNEISVCIDSMNAAKDVPEDGLFSEYRNATIALTASAQTALRGMVDYLEEKDIDLETAASNMVLAADKLEAVKTAREECLNASTLTDAEAAAQFEETPLTNLLLESAGVGANLEPDPASSPKPDPAPEPEPAPAPDPKPEPAPEPETPAAAEPVKQGVIGNKNSKKYHEIGCGSIADIKESNKIKIESAEAALAKGYEPCQRCH